VADRLALLDNELPVEFIDTDPDRRLDRPALMAGLREVADLINATTWTAAQRAAFLSMRKIVFFLGSAEVAGYELQRPGCDEAAAVFYWEVGEFLANTDAGVRANILFHDCWHVVQFKALGFAADEDERVAREVDALERQVEVAEAMNCSPQDIQFLKDFAADQQAIKDRLAFGVENMHDA